MGENDKKRQEEKGFGGLASLVPKVDLSASPEPESDSADSVAPSAHSATQPIQPPQPPQPPQPQHRQPPLGEPQARQEPVQPVSDGSSGGKWLIGIAAVFGLIWLIAQFDTDSPTSASADSPSIQSAAPTYSPSDQTQTLSGLQESTPPVGQDLVLSIAQIRYCLAEEIRMEGAETGVDENSQRDIDRFNSSVNDYNSRCSQFRYRQGSLDAAKRDVEQYRAQLLLDGKSRFDSSSNAESGHWAAGDATPAANNSLADAAAARRSEPPSSPPSTHVQSPHSADPYVRAEYDSENQRALARLAEAHAVEASKKAESQRISSTPGAHKRWDYKTGRDIWVDAYGNPIE